MFGGQRGGERVGGGVRVGYGVEQGPHMAVPEMAGLGPVARPWSKSPMR